MKAAIYTVMAAALTAGAAAGLFAWTVPSRRAASLLRAARDVRPDGTARFEYPFDGTVFPPDLAPPAFTWRAADLAVERWLLAAEFADGRAPLAVFTDTPTWRPGRRAWRRFVARCCEGPAAVTVLGLTGNGRGAGVLCAATVRVSVSPHPVGAPIFYREVNLPFSEAVKDPSRIRWRLGPVSAVRPRVVLEKLPVCGNCHSFSRDGRVLGMDVDYANDKGSYVTARVEPEIELTPDKLFSWSGYRPEDGVQTFGLLSQVSPDGRYVISTVKDRSVFLPMPDLAFSQLFFPIRGILVVYDRQTGTFAPLPGADDPAYVQSNPAWSPDGRTVIFARSRVHELRRPVRKDAVLLRREECEEFLSGGMTFRYDLCTVPFNNGRGGTARPLPGASGNGASNFFPKYSPDGRWIVFCKAASFMLLQPDSELYIVPSGGGEARRLACNMSRMNSWHSWSPNGRWLVFASKSGSPYTRLFLTQIDERGASTPAVLLDRFTEPGRAANIPEFVASGDAAMRCIRERFVDDVSLVRSGVALQEGGAYDRALAQYRRALALNKDSVDARVNMGAALSDKNELEAAAACLREALARAPGNATAWYNLAVTEAKRQRMDEAIRCCAEAVRLNPESASAQGNLGVLLVQRGRLAEAEAPLRAALRLDPDKANVHAALGRALAGLGRRQEADRHYAEAARLARDRQGRP